MVFILLPLLAIGGFLFYLASVSSRNSYTCPECGEKFDDMEHMSAKRCNMCGAAFNQSVHKTLEETIE